MSDTAKRTTGAGSSLVPSFLGPIANEPRLYRELEAPLRRRLLDPALSIGWDDIEVVGVTPIPTKPVVQQTAHGAWFFAAAYFNDPGLTQDGAIAVPERVLVELRALREAGLDADFVWIAHELPADWTPGQPLPAVVPDPKRVRDLDVDLERLVHRATSTWWRAARGLATGLVSVVGAAAAAAAEGPRLDPVILAGIAHPTEPVAIWAKVAQWEWE
jgi:hypothetical protein